MTWLQHLHSTYGPWLSALLPGLKITIETSILVIAVAIVVGFILALCRMSHFTPLRLLATCVIEVERGIPALVQLYFVYFGLAGVGIVLQAMPATVVALGLNAAAYMAEIYRGALAAVDPAQRQAALALGMKPFQAIGHILVPQAWKLALPPAATLAIAEFKDTSLASVIALPELMDKANALVGVTFRPLPVYVLAALLYAIVGVPATLATRRLERRMRGLESVADPAGERLAARRVTVNASGQ